MARDWWSHTSWMRISPLFEGFFSEIFPFLFPCKCTLDPDPSSFKTTSGWVWMVLKDGFHGIVNTVRISVPVFEGVIFSFLFSHCLFLWLQYNSSVVSRLWWDRNSRGSTYSSHVRGQWPETDDHTHREWEFQVLCWRANSWSIPQGNSTSVNFFLGLTAYSWIIT